MKVDYFHERPKVWHGNIKWNPAHPMRDGRFPRTHPAAPGSTFFPNAGDSQLGTSEQMVAFRARGYWASCFPEGDGITLRCLQEQGADQAAADIREVFGWEVRVMRT